MLERDACVGFARDSDPPALTRPRNRIAHGASRDPRAGNAMTCETHETFKFDAVSIHAELSHERVGKVMRPRRRPLNSQEPKAPANNSRRILPCAEPSPTASTEERGVKKRDGSDEDRDRLRLHPRLLV